MQNSIEKFVDTLAARRIRIHRVLAVVVTVLTLTSTTTLAGRDYSDIDTDLMRMMDDTIKSLEPYLSARNAAAGVDGAQLLQDGLKWTEDYFLAKGTAPDAVQLAQEGQRHASAVLKALASQDFSGAIEATRQTQKACRNCHDIYKP